MEEKKQLNQKMLMFKKMHTKNDLVKESYNLDAYENLKRNLRSQVKSMQINLLKEKKILIIYTGGTIGMCKTDNGLSPQANFLFDYMYNHPNFCDKDYLNINKDLYEDGFLVTPITILETRIFYRIVEFEKVIDSANMKLSYWKEIGSAVSQYYKDYDGFIILHGTDTLGYTSSILSFQFENLNKPIIITGSQIPLSEMRNDAIKNLVDAITIAGFYHIPEVCVMFNGKLMRGNRTIKIDSMNIDAFDTPNMRPLVEMGIQIKVNWDLILPTPTEDFKYFEDIRNTISIVKFFPIIKDETFASFFQKPVEAVIIETYGAGNLPTNRPRINEILKKACDEGIIVVNVSQCRKGLVIGAYETGNALQRIGVIFAGDMTVECAMSKLSYLLGEMQKKIRQQFTENLRGEVTVKGKEFFSLQSNVFITGLLKVMNLNKNEEECYIVAKTLLPTVINELAEQNRLDMLKKMQNEINCINFRDHCKKNPLHIVAITGNKEITEYLIKCRIPINDIDDQGMTPLNYACQKKNSEVAKIIRNSGGILNSSLDLSLFFCNLAYLGDLETIRLFYECGANLLCCTYDRRTIAHVAAAEGHTEIIAYLIFDARLNIMIQDRWGNTPLDNGTEEIKNLINQKFSTQCSSPKREIARIPIKKEDSKQTKLVKFQSPKIKKVNFSSENQTVLVSDRETN